MGVVKLFEDFELLFHELLVYLMGSESVFVNLFDSDRRICLDVHRLEDLAEASFAELFLPLVL